MVTRKKRTTIKMGLLSVKQFVACQNLLDGILRFEIFTDLPYVQWKLRNVSSTQNEKFLT